MKYAFFVLLFLASPAFAADPVYTWRTTPTDPDRVYLYRDGTQIGGWCYRDKYYRSYDGATWGNPTDKAPVQPPLRIVQTVVIKPGTPRWQGPQLWQSPELRFRPVARMYTRVMEAATVQVLGSMSEAIGKALEESLRQMAEKK